MDGGVYETPQFMYIMIALTIFREYPKATRSFICQKILRRNLKAPNQHSHTYHGRSANSTSTICGICVLVDVDDTLDSIFSSDITYWSLCCSKGRNRYQRKSGIRGINSKIRGGEVQHTGVVPFLKKFESTVRCCTQNGIRGGSATVHFPIWHQEIEDIIVLKNNKGTEDNRVRKLDYSIQISKIFYERFIKNSDITLFSPHDVPGLYDAFGTDKFDDLYVIFESDESIPKKTVNAQKLILDILKERAETGRLYLMNIDHCNSHSSFKDKVEMSNLCQEITLPTYPLQHIDDEYGEIALCILSAINIGKVNSDKELEEMCDLSVRSLDELIDYQNYPIKAAEISTKARRSLGIGFIGLAHYLAKLGFKYDSQEAWDAVHQMAESFQFFLLKSSNQLAQEKGHCEYFGRTKYADGILPIDTYKKDVDEISTQS